MQARERELHLRLHAGRASHGEIRGRLDEVPQERRLPDPSLAPQHEHPAAPDPDSCEETIERRALDPATTQHELAGSRAIASHETTIIRPSGWANGGAEPLATGSPGPAAGTVSGTTQEQRLAERDPLSLDGSTYSRNTRRV
jgi:hypothetical protein